MVVDIISQVRARKFTGIKSGAKLAQCGETVRQLRAVQSLDFPKDCFVHKSPCGFAPFYTPSLLRRISSTSAKDFSGI
jgi:hypothetical protein